MRNAWIRYRIMAWLVGTLLVVLVCVGLPLKYIGGDDTVVLWTAIPHGYLYMLLLITAVDLGLRAKWSWKRLILIALAGTVPFLSFVAERSATKDVRREARGSSRSAAPQRPPPECRFVDIAGLWASLSKPFNGLRAHLLAPDQRDDALQVIHRGELDDDLALGPAQFDFHPSLEMVGEPISEILGLGRHDLGLMPAPWSPVSVITEGHQLLDRAYG